MDELKPCPFCGNAGMITYNVFNGFIPFCINDSCILNELEYGFDTEKEAMEAWNRRANDGKIH